MATSFHKVNNNAASTLNAAIDDNDLSLAVPTGEGAEFDTVTQYLTLGRSDTYNGEILDVASRSSDTFTVTTRGVDGTSATAHDAGDRVECLLVAAHITEIQDAINAIENGTVTLAKVITSGTAANTHTIADSATNTVVSLLELYHLSSGTPAAGLGAKLILGAEDAAGTATAAMELHGYLTDVTDGSEDGAFKLRLMTAGTIADALTVALNSMTFYDDTDSTAIFGRCRLASATSDRAQFAHRDRSASNQYALSHLAGGDLHVNGTTNLYLQINASNVMTLTSTNVAFAQRPTFAETASPTSGGTGTAGMFTWDASYLYICTATNTWKRVAITGGY